MSIFLHLSAVPSSLNPDITVVSLESSEPIQGFSLSDLTLTRCNATNLNEVNPGSQWTFDLTPTEPGSFAASIPSGILLAASNGAPASGSNLLVRNYKAPAVTIEPDECWLNGPVEVTITWSKEVNDFTEADIQTNGASVSGFTQQDSTTWTATITPSSTEDEIMVNIPAGTAVDALGKANTNPGFWSAYSAGIPPKAVRPVLEQVWAETDGTFTAVFGYLNDNACRIVGIDIGGKNKFTPGPQDRGQPEVFQPGRQVAVYEVPFTGGNLVWTLQSPNGSRRTATANSGIAVPRASLS